MNLSTLAGLLASLVFFGAFVIATSGRRRPGFWVLSWGLMIGAGILLALDLPAPFKEAARLAAGLFAGLQLAGAYGYVGVAVPRWVLPATFGVTILRSGVALAGHHDWSHAAVLLFEIALLGWSGRVILARAPARREPIDWLLALGAASLCGVETMDAVFDVGRPDGAVMWAPWMVLGSAVGVLQMVGVSERIQRVALEKRRVREERQRTTQRLESLGVLAGGIAHDFNNLLTGILGNAELALLDLDEDHPARNSVEQVQDSTLRAAELAGQMLAYASRRGLEPEPVDLARTLRERAALLRTAVGTEVELGVDAPAGLPHVLADPSQLDQVLLNLAINAGEACGERGGRVRLALTVDEIEEETPATVIGELQEGRYLKLSVSDDGRGIEAPVSRIFDPFFSTKFSGRGMGLAVTQQIVSAHGGAIAVESGDGTRFDVYFPAPIGRTVQAPKSAESPPTRFRPGHIVVVDDDRAVLDVAGRALRAAGHRVTSLHGGQAALEALRDEALRPSLLLLDATMPEVGALDVIRWVKAERPTLRILMMTGHDAGRLAEAFHDPAIVGWMRKPFRLAALRNRVAEHLSR